jgi:RHS repeat-associated protein
MPSRLEGNRVRLLFAGFLLVQALHLGEHAVQMVQLHLLGWPAASAKGVVSALDVEKVHAGWNVAVLLGIGWLLRSGARNGWLVAAFVWATLHTVEHGYLVTRALLSGLEGQPGILGDAGLLASLGWSAPGFTTWSRPMVHFFWNLGEVLLLALAYGLNIRWAPAVAAALLAFVLVPNRGDLQPGSFQYVNATDPICAGHAPCHSIIQAAVAAALPGQTIIVQSGTYVEQVLVQGKNNIVIEADPSSALGTVVLDGASAGCTDGYAIRLQRSKLITIRGLTITGAGGPAIQLMGGNNQNQGIRLERLRIFGNGSSECAGGITIGRGNPETIIANSLIYGNGRHGIATIDADGGPHYIVGNTIHGNAWSGVSLSRNHTAVLVNNAIIANGTAAGSTGGRFGIKRESSTTPRPDGIRLFNNLVCGNRLGELDGPVLDGSDAGNLTPTGREGPGVDASRGCADMATVYESVPGDDFTLAARSPAVDNGMDPRRLGLDSQLDAIFEADFADEAVRPQAGSANRAARFDIGALELVLPDRQAPSVRFMQPPARGFVRRTVTVEAQADDDTAVATLALTVDGRPLSSTLNPPRSAPSVTATGRLDTTILPDGSHTLAATATDEARNRGSATRVITVDNTPPETQITGGPHGEVRETTATFTFTGADAFTSVARLVFAWRLDDGRFTAFSTASTATLTGLTEGSHVFEVKSRDLAGNEDPSPARRAFVVVRGVVVTAVDPPSGQIGTLVTITGSGFTPGASQVAFNGIAAVVRSLTPSSLVTTVPPGASTGPVTVTTASGTASRPFSIVSAQDFAVQALPAAATVLQGSSATYVVRLSSAGTAPFSGLASLSITGAPVGFNAMFSPAAVLTGGQSTTLTITAGASAPPGPIPLTLTARAPTDIGIQTRTATVTLEVIPGGRTAVLGRFTFADGRPITGVRTTIGSVTGGTDAAGSFHLVDVPDGAQMLMIDANAAQPGLPIYAVELTVRGGQAMELPPFRITPPPPSENFIPIANAAQDQVVTDPRFPGFALTLPAGATITGWDGQLKTRIAVERLAPDALPVLPPPFGAKSFYQVFFGTPMGGLPSAPLPVSVPNDQDYAPGESVEIWYYDAAPFPGVPAGWRMAGLGTVSDDGTSVVSNPGVGLERFCGVCGVTCIRAKADAQANVKPGGAKVSEPVDLATGVFTVEKTDLAIPGRLAMVVRRHFNPLDPFGRVAGFELPTGPGWSLSVDAVLLEDSPSLRRLIMPGNSRYSFTRQADGTFANTTDAEFVGAVLKAEAAGRHRLRFKHGTVWTFASGWIPRGRLIAIAGLGLLVEERDRVGNTLTITREAAGAVTQITDPVGRALNTTLTELIPGIPTSVRLTEITDPLGRTIRYSYDVQTLRLDTVTDLAGGLTRYTYDAAGRILTITDPRGITYVSNDYDAQGRVVRQAQADGGLWHFSYEGPASAHTAAAVTDPRGNTTTHRMTVGGLTTEVIDALGQSTRYQRDAAGRITAVTDALGRTVTFTYDAQGNLTAATDPAGQISTFGYDPVFNRVATVRDPLGNVMGFEFDARGNLTAVVDALSARTTITYNAVGQPVGTADPLGHMTGFTYDTNGNLATIVDPAGNVAVREYDAASRLVRETDPLGRATTFAYDALDRMRQVTDALGGTTHLTYDANGNLLTVTDPNGNTVTHTHDTMDRLSTRTDATGRVERFEYDAVGNLARLTDRNNRVVAYRYDAADRRIGVDYADGSSTAFVHDAANRLAQATDTAGSTLINQYDGLGRLAAQHGPHGTVAYQYDVLSRRTRFEAPGQAPTTYVYDAASRLTQITQGPQVVSLEYDSVGRRRRLALPNGVVTEYEYDAASRLGRVTYRNAAGAVGDLSHEYDASGSLVQLSGSLARTLLPAPLASATHDADNRLLSFGDQAFSYDGAGNVTSISAPSGLTTYTWDPRNRLVEFTGPPVSASFAYDPFGRRLSKTANGATTRYLYDGPDIAQELRDSASTYLRLPAIDAALARDGQEFYLAEGLGSILGVTDTSGSLTTRYMYDPFGNTTVDGAPSDNPLQYTGREHDETGLYYYRARYYSPAHHRFLGQDFVLRPGANRYAYAGNNPSNAVDPLGLDTLIIYGGSPSKGPNRSLRFLGGNPGLINLARDLRGQQEPVAIFNSGQQKEVVDLAKRIRASGRPLYIIGHSLGGRRALAAVHELTNHGITPDHVFTIDAFISDDATVPPGVPITNFYQMQSFINGRPIADATNIEISDRGIGHFSITDHAMVRETILQTIAGGLQSEAVLPGGRY